MSSTLLHCTVKRTRNCKIMDTEIKNFRKILDNNLKQLKYPYARGITNSLDTLDCSETNYHTNKTHQNISVFMDNWDKSRKLMFSYLNHLYTLKITQHLDPVSLNIIKSFIKFCYNYELKIVQMFKDTKVVAIIALREEFLQTKAKFKFIQYIDDIFIEKNYFDKLNVICNNLSGATITENTKELCIKSAELKSMKSHMDQNQEDSTARRNLMSDYMWHWQKFQACLLSFIADNFLILYNTIIVQQFHSFMEQQTQYVQSINMKLNEKVPHTEIEKIALLK